ncbi:acyl-CoA thioester hydrolase/BAAT C-terminal domain-containing protein [Spongiimicrobium salis]|uniref:acyl-CoA thioester hydrolase/BAAT C-terminal domain-containing protein n=1 Tax=Spongiimicrobium salis TaxID=1667022 RepID=UPI00374D73AD
MKKNRKYSISIGLAVVLIVGYLVADSILFDGVRSKPIHENGFQANYFAQDGIENKTTIILIGGGRWGDYWAQEFAKKEMVGLSLPYSGKEGLPRLPEAIDLEYFERAIEWLGNQKEVNSDKIMVMGASRNAELALVLASTLPKMISGVIAYAPSAVSWSNTVLPYNSNTLKPSWRYKGTAIPYLPMEKIKGDSSNTIQMIPYWENGLAKTGLADKAAIQVEQVNGPILLFSGIDDKVWPSVKMADMIEKRLKENDFQYPFKNIKYEDAGHLISTNPAQNSNTKLGQLHIDGRDYEYEFGGTDDGNFKAKKDAYAQVFNFLSSLKNE